MSLISLWIHSNVYINKDGDIFQNFESLTIFIHWNLYLTNLDYPRRLPSIHIDFVLSQHTPNASLWSKCNSLQVSLHASLISLLWCHCFAAPSSQPIICRTWIDQEVGHTRFPALESVCMFYYGEFSLAHCDIFLTTDWLFPGYSYRCSIFHPDRVSSLAPANELLSELDSKMASCFWLSL